MNLDEMFVNDSVVEASLHYRPSKGFYGTTAMGSLVAFYKTIDVKTGETIDCGFGTPGQIANMHKYRKEGTDIVLPLKQGYDRPVTTSTLRSLKYDERVHERRKGAN